jgi:hypothetical protein
MNPMSPEDWSGLLVALARIEAKLEAALTGQVDHEARIRILERKDSAADHELRLRSIESRGYVTGKQMWAGLIGSATVTSAVIAAVALLTK